MKIDPDGSLTFTLSEPMPVVAVMSLEESLKSWGLTLEDTSMNEERAVAVQAKRVFNRAIRKLRTAVEAGDVTPGQAKSIREAWYDRADMPEECREIAAALRSDEPE